LCEFASFGHASCRYQVVSRRSKVRDHEFLQLILHSHYGWTLFFLPATYRCVWAEVIIVALGITDDANTHNKVRSLSLFQSVHHSSGLNL
jgi:hypothetical protein